MKFEFAGYLFVIVGLLSFVSDVFPLFLTSALFSTFFLFLFTLGFWASEERD